MDDRLVFVIKLALGTVLMALVQTWGLSWVNISRETMMWSLFMTMMVWGLWTLRRIGNK